MDASAGPWPRKGFFSLSPYRQPRVGDEFGIARVSVRNVAALVVGELAPCPIRRVCHYGVGGTPPPICSPEQRTHHGDRGRSHVRGRHHRTASYKDFLFDIGGHRFFSKSKEVVDLWKEILPDDFIERPRLSRIYYNGSYFSYPLKAFEALNNLGYVESALCVLSFLHKQAFPTANPENFHDWVANQFGERLFDLLQDLHREGGARAATRFRPIGRHSASRA
jgi:hypothetical protein